MKNMQEKYKRIWEEYINGNISSFKEDIRAISKKELINLIRFSYENSGKTWKEILALFETHL